MKTVSAHFDVISKANTAKLLVEQAVPQRQKTSSSLVLKNQLQSSGRQSAELRCAGDDGFRAAKECSADKTIKKTLTSP